MNLLLGASLATTVSVTDATAQEKYSFQAEEVTTQSTTSPVLRSTPEQFPSEKLGKVVSIMKEDFSLMTLGTEDKPDFGTNIINDLNEEYPVWFNLDTKYTQGDKKWGTGKSFSAGGTLALCTKEAKINTYLLDLSGNQGNFFVRFRIKGSRALEQGEGAMLKVEAAETNKMSASWNTCYGGATILPTADWKTYEVPFQGGGATTLINIVKMSSDEEYFVLIDDIEVVQVEPFVAMPTLKKHLHYTGTSIDLYWEKVEGATGYSLTAWRMVPTGEKPANPQAPLPMKRENLVVDQKIDGGETTTYNLTGLASGDIYFYTLKALKDSKESIPCQPNMIYDLEKPQIKAIEKSVNGSFDVTWKEVPFATLINVWSYFDKEAEKDGAFEILNEDFAKIVDVSGKKLDFTPDNPDKDNQRVSRAIVPNIGMAGWLIQNGRCWNGCIMLDNWIHINNADENTSLTSPEMDLSGNGGKVKISVDLWGQEEHPMDKNKQPILDEDGKPIVRQVWATVALFTYDEATEDYVQIESVDLKDVYAGWDTYEVAFTKATKRSIIGIFPRHGAECLFIDNLKISQDLKKGDKFRHCCGFGVSIPTKWTPVPTKAKFFVNKPYRKLDTEFFVRINGVLARNGKDQYSSAVFKNCAYSDYVSVKNTVDDKVEDPDFYGGVLGVKKVGREKASIATSKNTLRINNPVAADIAIYTINGERVYNDHSKAKTVSVELARGVYVVHVGTEVIKVAL